jgi:hypothetical protein
MMPNPCEECSHCHTSALKDENGVNKPAIPHEFNTTFVQTDEGSKPLSRCKWCYKTKKQIELDNWEKQ